MFLLYIASLLRFSGFRVSNAFAERFFSTNVNSLLLIFSKNELDENPCKHVICNV